MTTENNKQVLNAPNLRFPEFNGEWESYTYNDLFDTISERNTNKGLTNVLSASQADGMTPRNSLGIDIKFNKESIKNYKIVRPGDYVIHLRSFQGGFAFSELLGICSPAYTILRPKALLQYGFLKSFFMSRKFIDSLRVVTYGIRDGKSISVDEWLKLRLFIPGSSEQRKVTKFLELIAEKIKTQSEIIDKLQLLIKATYQYVQTTGKSNGTWKDTKLSEVLTERKEYNTENHTVYSVSVSAGVVNQIEYLGRSFSAKDTTNYNVVRHGDVVYTKSPTGNFPYGIVKRSCVLCAVAVSPLYGVYRPIYDEMGILIHYYFLSPINTHNYLHPLIQKGAKNTINISDNHFLDNAIPLPAHKEEAMRVAKVITMVQNKLDLEKGILKRVKIQKQYLLQQLFI